MEFGGWLRITAVRKLRQQRRRRNAARRGQTALRLFGSFRPVMPSPLQNKTLAIKTNHPLGTTHNKASQCGALLCAGPRGWMRTIAVRQARTRRGLTALRLFGLICPEQFSQTRDQITLTPLIFQKHRPASSKRNLLNGIIIYTARFTTIS